MRAFIKEGCWVSFVTTSVSYGFFSNKIPEGSSAYEKYGGITYSRPYDYLDSQPDPYNIVYLTVTLNRELHIITPMGESPFMESHEKAFKDLVDANMIEYVKGDYD